MMVIDNKYDIGAFVYLTTDPDQHRRIVTGIKICKGGELIYEISFGTQTSNHYEFELSAEKDITLTTNG